MTPSNCFSSPSFCAPAPLLPYSQWCHAKHCVTRRKRGRQHLPTHATLFMDPQFQNHNLQSNVETATRKKQDYTSHIAEVDGVEVHYTLSDPYPSTRSSGLLLCIHGFGASSFSFQPLNQTLSQHSTYPRQINNSYRPTLLSYDAPGFGLTTRPKKLEYFSHTFSARIATLLADSFSLGASPGDGDTKFGIMAHSRGALTAFRVAVDNPGKVSHIVLVSPAIYTHRRQGAICKWVHSVGVALLLTLSSITSPLFTYLLQKSVGRRSFWEQTLELARHSSRPPNEGTVDGYFCPVFIKGWEKGMIKFTQAQLVESIFGHGESTVSEFVKLCKVAGRERSPKVLIVYGDDDMMYDDKHFWDIGRLIGGATMVRMEQCGHIPHEEDPSEVLRVLDGFMKDSRH